MTAVRTAHPTKPLLTLFDPPIELAGLGPGGHLHRTFGGRSSPSDPRTEPLDAHLAEPRGFLADPVADIRHDRCRRRRCGQPVKRSNAGIEKTNVPMNHSPDASRPLKCLYPDPFR